MRENLDPTAEAALLSLLNTAKALHDWSNVMSAVPGIELSPDSIADPLSAVLDAIGFPGAPHRDWVYETWFDLMRGSRPWNAQEFLDWLLEEGETIRNDSDQIGEEQGGSDRLKRLNRGCCPVHDLSMTQITSFDFVAKVGRLKGRSYCLVQCPHESCEITARAAGFEGPWELQPEYLHVLRGRHSTQEELEQ